MHVNILPLLYSAQLKSLALEMGAEFKKRLDHKCTHYVYQVAAIKIVPLMCSFTVLLRNPNDYTLILGIICTCRISIICIFISRIDSLKDSAA